MSSGTTTAEYPSRNKQKRHGPRKAIETLVYADLGPGNGGFPINVSEGGMSFQGIQPLAKNDIIRIKFKLPDTQDVVESEAKVAWMNELGKGGGLHFIDLPAESRRQINQWLSLQATPETPNEIISADVAQDQINEIQPAESVSITARDVEVPSTMVANPVVPSPPLLSVDPNEIRVDAKSTPKLLPPVETPQRASQKSEKKKAWLVPFAIGVAASLVLVAVSMAISGVISVQFHWPKASTTGITATSVSAPAAANESASPIAKISDATSDERIAPTLPPSKSLSAHQSAPPAPKPAALAPSVAIAKAPANVVPPKSSLELVTATLKPVAPARSATVGDQPPPPIAPDARPESTLQLPTITSASPARPVTVPTRSNAALEPAQLLVRKDPVYPQDAKSSGISGSVELHFKITTDGDVENIKVLKGNFLLVRGAIAALQSWRYQPAKLNGIPVESESNAVFTFKPN